MSDLLTTMAASSRARADAVTRRFTDDDLDRPAFPLSLGNFDLIAEIKLRSPAEGELSATAGDPGVRAQDYAKGGAAAISVLTEPDRFDGSLDDLEAVVAATADDQVPVMRKDFLVDPVQILEAKAAGASGVLLIAALFDGDGIQKMLDCAFEHDLFVLLESFDAVDLELTAHLLERPHYRDQSENKKLLVGVNTRNLRTLAVDPDRLRRLGPELPANAYCVAESGLHTAEDAGDVVRWGYRVALVGTALMRAEDPAALIAAMLAAGRSV